MQFVGCISFASFARVVAGRSVDIAPLAWRVLLATRTRTRFGWVLVVVYTVFLGRNTHPTLVGFSGSCYI